MPLTNIMPIMKSFQNIRKKTLNLVEPLEKEDFIIQSHPDVSPPKWHLAHTTWFFEKFILKEYDVTYQEFHPSYDYLFNSYYETVGPYQPRHERGVLSRPAIDNVMDYRKHVDDRMERFFTTLTDPLQLHQIESVLEIGLQHEQQHQELILMDVKYNFFVHPFFPVYSENSNESYKQKETQYVAFKGGLVEVGHDGEGFSFDNEKPRHKVWLESFKLASHPVTNGEYLEFIEAGGYESPEYWLSDGWNEIHSKEWKAPLYWKENDQGEWNHFTLSGVKDLNKDEPVCHVSFYEADAYARWRGKRLPTEAEWEHAASCLNISGNTLEKGHYHPTAFVEEGEEILFKMVGDVWEWTSSSYSPYPRNKPLEGALGEYNAKFMCNQMVLRGGACVTPLSHIRNTYRNFFPANKRWQFSGIRLAEDGK